MHPNKMKQTPQSPEERIHEMIADHNSSRAKVFYYSEDEVRRIARIASQSNIPPSTFDVWWDGIKKK